MNAKTQSRLPRAPMCWAPPRSAGDAHLAYLTSNAFYEPKIIKHYRRWLLTKFTWMALGVFVGAFLTAFALLPYARAALVKAGIM